MTDAEKMVRLAVQALEDKKGQDIAVLNISEVSVVADYFVIVSGENERQTAALKDAVEETLFKEHFMPRSIEGALSKSWTLLDYNDVIIHIFSRQDRLFYDLERIWRDGKRIPLEELRGPEK